jgi:hypothetical protein
MIKSRTVGQLNHAVAGKRAGWVIGVLDAANMINEMYSSCTTHQCLLGDCLLFKLNLLKKSQVRKNPYARLRTAQ